MTTVPTTVLLAELTREQVRELAPRATVVLPTAAIEQHGPHLPLLTDAAACTAICQRAAEVASAEVPVVVAPTLPYGYSHHHRPHPGVLSLSWTTFAYAVRDLCESLYESGFRRIAIINGHGGNDEIIRVVARDLNFALPLSVAAASYWTIAWQALVAEAGAEGLDRLPGHAGSFETSLVLALRPELVDRAAMPPALAATKSPSVQILEPTVLPAGTRLGTGPGYNDDPGAGSVERGERYLATIVREVAAFLVRFHRRHPEN
jgi:creatinine amidohydrolase